MITLRCPEAAAGVALKGLLPAAGAALNPVNAGAVLPAPKLKLGVVPAENWKAVLEGVAPAPRAPAPRGPVLATGSDGFAPNWNSPPDADFSVVEVVPPKLKLGVELKPVVPVPAVD